MIYPINHLPSVIKVGVQTESGVEDIGFDLSPWLTRWPDLTFAVWPTRPGERASYIAADTKMVGNVLYWYPNSTDTEKEGAGTVEVVGIGGGKCKSSGVIDTLVKKTSLDVTQETPEPFKPWAEKIMAAADVILNATPSETVILPETAMSEIDAGSGQFVLWRKPEKALVSGGLYKVVYNGTPFELAAVPLEGEPAHALGNMSLLGIGADTGEPFVAGIIDTPTGGDDAPGLVVVNDGSATITLSISEISTPGNASTPQHTITIGEDGSVTSSATFEELARMTDAQIQSSVTVVWTDTYSGVPVSMTSAIDRVTRMVASEAGVEWLQLRFAVMADFVDQAYTAEATRYIEWLKNNGAPTVPNRHTQTLPYMTHWDRGAAYMRYNGERWEPVGIEQLKADLGIGGGGGDTTTDVFYTADGEVFTTVDGAVLHIQKGDQ